MALPSSERPWIKALGLSRRPSVARRSRMGRTAPRVGVELLEGRTLLASGSNWTALTNLAPTSLGTMMLLTDGTVMAEGAGVNKSWYKLTPDTNGSYANGTWSTSAPMSINRLYFGSNMLQNGNIFLVGGEYSGPSGTANWTNTGEMYNSATNSWSPIATFPNTQFGDDPTMLLPNGDVLAGYLSGPQTYIYHVGSNTWTPTGTKLNGDRSDEETWIKLADDSILSYDVFTNGGAAGSPAQRYVPSTGTWVAAGTVPVALTNLGSLGAEMGPATVLPNGKVLQIGANSNTALYDPTTNSWTAGPTIPLDSLGRVQGADDTPGVQLPNGHFLFTVDRSLFNSPTKVMDYDPTANTITDVTPTVANGDPAGLVNQLAGAPAYINRFLMLPNGQALFTTGQSQQTYLYTATGALNTSSTPSITGITPNGGNSYTLTGSALNGASQGASYGDDAEMDSNYPIARVATNIGTTYYARTTNWNKTGIGVTNGATSTDFSLPAAISQPPVVTLSSLGAVAEGQVLSNVTVATFTDPNGPHTGQYLATITWGDSTGTQGVISGPVGGVYTITGSHTYTEEGPLTFSVSVVDNYASGNLVVSGAGISSTPVIFNLSGSSSTTFTVTDPSVIGTGVSTINAVAGVSTGTITLATFTDPAGAEALGNYSASIDWGDGTSAGAITGPVSGVFTVTGSHIYTAGGVFTVKVTINHDTSTPIVVNDSANVVGSITTVTNVTSTTPNGTYGLNAVILINVTFSGTETVTGTPQLALNSGGTANYSSGSGTNTLTFTYNVGAGENSSHLDYTSTTALTLNGGTIKGPGGLPATLTLPAPGMPGSLGANTSTVIDTVAPTVLSYNVLFGTVGSYNVIGSPRLDLPWTITGIQVLFSKSITTGDINSLTGVTSTGFSGLGTTTLTWAISPLTLGTFSTSLVGTGADKLTDLAGNPLMGGAGFMQNFKVLLGDFNGDLSVSSSDMLGVYYATATPYNIFADINGDGFVNMSDVMIARSRIGTHL